MDPRISKALETWHGGEGSEGLLNMSMSLAGETGEVINLYRKRLFKPNYVLTREMALDELGDVWYYIRIFCHLENQPLPHYDLPKEPLSKAEFIEHLVKLQKEVGYIFEFSTGNLGYLLNIPRTLDKLVSRLCYLLSKWNCSLDELTELNYQKLTKNADHHGWNPSDDLQKMPIEEYKRLTQHTWVDENKEEEQTSYENVPQQEEDWREGMQKRIALLKQETIEKRGRWY